MKTRYLFFTFFVLNAWGATNAAEIKFLGTTDGEEIVQSFTGSSMKKALPKLYESLIENNAAAFDEKNSNFSNLKMPKKTLYVGASLGAQIGVADILKVEAIPSFYLIFEN